MTIINNQYYFVIHTLYQIVQKLLFPVKVSVRFINIYFYTLHCYIM